MQKNLDRERLGDYNIKRREGEVSVGAKYA